ncbi:MAG: hypothetical protein AB1640_16630 [bacterium]
MTALDPGGGIPWADEFKIWSPQGMGDRQNSWIWSLQWWNGRLYAGTSRAPMCVNLRTASIGIPFFPYESPDPDLECTPDPNDLPLRAEIWRWDPMADLWERVYRSPEDIPIPGTDKKVARDIGYRAMEVFREPDGTEALYVSGVTSRPIHHDEPRPPGARILRSTDGTRFEAVPQDPGTYLGDIENASFRGMASYKGRLFILAGTYTGPGVVLESANPRAGNDSFHKASPPGMRVMEIESYNGHLYFGLRDTSGLGYSVVRTDAEGERPYSFTTVVPPGAGITVSPNTDVLSMVEFKGYLYCGGNAIGNDLGAPPDIGEPKTLALRDAPPPPPEVNEYLKGAELIRIGPDDRWDLVVGRPRDTPDGYKVPLSGFSSGFNYPFNNHFWRMAVHDDVLYLGTFDSSTVYKEILPLTDFVGELMGFDLYASSDGVHFRSITRNGFGDRLQCGCRSLASTPYGLFLGTATFYYGAFVYRLAP